MSGNRKAGEPAEIAAIEDTAIDFGDIPELDDAFWREAASWSSRFGPSRLHCA